MMKNTNDGLRACGDGLDKFLEDSSVEGKVLGKYRLGEEIGSGGMGTVYLAEDTSLGRTVVIKVVKFLSGDAESRKMMVARFRREAQAACRVMHPNVAVTFAFDEIEGRHLLVMERIDGRTLRDELMTELGRPRAMSPRKAVSVVIEILKGLTAIHAAKIVHRDLKPGNVMLTHKDDQVKILDFGLGKASESLGDLALDMTLTQQGGPPIGSPMYMSPEQTRSLPVDEGTDIYSVGVMLFQLLTGKAPFRGRDHVEIYDQHRNAAVPLMVVPSGAPLPPELEAVVRKAMAKAPGDRYGSASAMVAALEAIDFEPKPKAAIKPRSSVHPWLLPLLALGAFALIAVGISLTTGKTATPRSPEAGIKTAQGGGLVKAVEVEKASDGISIPPPPPVIATIAQGCELYTRGRTTDAIKTLTRALETSPADTEGLYCLCGAYVRQPETHAEAQKTCKAYLARPDRDADKTRQVGLWLRRRKW